MKEKAINIIIIISYFIVTIVFLGSVGIWLPLAIDDYNLGKTSTETFASLNSNILTYALGIFLVAAIDRILHLLFKTSKYSNNVLEFFGIVFSCIITGVLVYFSMRALKNSLLEDAIEWSTYITFIAWGAWIYVKLQGSKSNNFSSIGGVI